MHKLSYAAATTVESYETIRARILADLSAAGLDVGGWGDLDAKRLLLDFEARSAASEQAIRASVARTINLAEAAKLGADWLDIVAKGRYQEDRIPALRARWVLRLAPAGLGSPQRTVAPGGIIAQDLLGVQFRLLGATPTGGDIVIPSGTTGGYVDAYFDAVVAGASGNSATGSIVGITRGPGGITVTNPSGTLITAGRDAETNRQYITRCYGKWSRLGAGWTKPAFDYFIPTAAPSVTRWLVRDDNPVGPGSIQVILANASGAATPTEVADVLAYLSSDDVKPLGSGALDVIAATQLAVNVTGSLKLDGSNPTALTDASTALATLAEAFPIGGQGGLLEEELVAAVVIGGGFAVYGLDGFVGVNGHSLTSPVADVTVGYDEVVVFSVSLTAA